ncbi:MAG TPA: hypothetical protein DIS79_00860 [Bacteroidetes bacterium]|nr:hypothetical protein [Bacteroidota bacterium]HRK05545.1 FKBP-type peptidyl-prolyl cis-trans isomerase [Chlorobiota bacterium]
MKILLMIAAVGITTLACNAQPKVNEVKPQTDKDTASYALGLNIGKAMKAQKMDVDPHVVAAGMRDAMADKPLMTDEQMNAALQKMQESAMKVQMEEREKAGAESLKKGQAFLEKNKKNPGVMTTPSGLQYRIDREGKGAKPQPTSTVKVHYKGTLLDGKTFDSSYDRNEPVEFALNQVIKGWQEGVALMNVGAKYTLWIPAELGYGPQGTGPIGPNEVLTFEVELLEIK